MINYKWRYQIEIAKTKMIKARIKAIDEVIK